MRIAICGAGVSGLTLAGILSRELPRSVASVSIDVFERSTPNRDQGYGLDLDSNGQVALAKAGVSREAYWQLSKPCSDSAAIYLGNDDAPGIISFRPRLLQNWFPGSFGARPESNRGALREALLTAMAPQNNVTMHFETGVYGMRQAKDSVSATLLDRESGSLGDFDLVIDGMGVHSTLRQHRVHDKAGGKHSSGLVMIHGVVDPESKFSSGLLAKLGQHGSMMGVARGYNILLQRFGAGREDNRTSFFYLLHREDGEAGVFNDVGVEPTQSRTSGIMEGERLQKVKDWILRDMRGVFAPMWDEVVTSLGRITIREQVVHGESELLSERKLPLICIGDSLWNCGLGGGGILAMQDALQIANLMTDPQSGFLNSETGRPDCELPKLCEIEEEMLKRKAEFNQRTGENRTKMLRRGTDAGTKIGWEDFLPGDSFMSRVMRYTASCTLPYICRLFVAWYNREAAKGTVGSDESSPVFPDVAKAYADQSIRAHL